MTRSIALLIAVFALYAPAAAETITVSDSYAVSATDPLRSYRVTRTGHLTITDGAIVDAIDVASGRLDVDGGSITGRVFVDGANAAFNVTAGTFLNSVAIVNRPMTVTIAGGDFTQNIRFDDSGWGGGSLLVTGGRPGGFGFAGSGSITWNAEIRGGIFDANVSGIAGNTVAVYGYWLDYSDSVEPDHTGNPVRVQRISGLLEDLSPFAWRVVGNQFANVYTLHDLGDLPGDLDLDRDVDIDDLNAVRNAFGTETDMDDLNAVRNNFGISVQDTAETISVPEPSGGGLAIVALSIAGFAYLMITARERT